jgi:Glycosyltransferases involved in cell wall biogenesis
MKDGKIDIIIPAYKAHKTIIKTLSSISMQTIIDKLSVTIVNDNCPNGDYSEFVKMFKPYMDIKEVKLEKNGGAGVARQNGIDNTDHEFFTCIDADDTFASAISLETMLAGITENEAFKCCSATFMQLGDDLMHIFPHQMDMVWMFGKIYRREWIEKNKIRFNNTRANEDAGFNMWVKLLCDNPMEQIRYIDETVYFWHNNENSITRINDGQYSYDQCFCGWTDNMIYAIQNAKKARPFSGQVTQQIVGVLLNLYYYYIETVARKPIFERQNWEYIKKFYHTCYKKIEEDITDEVFSQMFSMASMEKHSSGSLIGIVPHIGIKEFMEKLHAEEYDANHIFEVWEQMRENPETKELIENNIKCGVCAEGYTNKPF